MSNSQKPAVVLIDWLVSCAPMAGLVFQVIPVVLGAATVPVPSTQVMSETSETAAGFAEVTELPNSRILAEVTVAATSVRLKRMNAWRVAPAATAFLTSQVG